MNILANAWIAAWRWICPGVLLVTIAPKAAPRCQRCLYLESLD